MCEVIILHFIPVLIHALYAFIASPICCAICGTIALPNPLSRSTLLGIPLATRPTSGSMCQSHCCVPRGDFQAFSASCPLVAPLCAHSLRVLATSSPLRTGTSCRACECDFCSPPDHSPCTPRLVASATF